MLLDKVGSLSQRMLRELIYFIIFQKKKKEKGKGEAGY